MSVVTLTLTDFLLARLDEDEAIAKAAHIGPWEIVGPGWTGLELYIVGAGHRMVRSEKTGETKSAGLQHIAAPYAEDAHHVVRHDPAHVLAEVAAKRRIVERHAEPNHNAEPADAVCSDVDRSYIVTPEECPDLRALASVYVDHPDFRAEWKSVP